MTFYIVYLKFDCMDVSSILRKQVNFFSFVIQQCNPTKQVILEGVQLSSIICWYIHMKTLWQNMEMPFTKHFNVKKEKDFMKTENMFKRSINDITFTVLVLIHKSICQGWIWGIGQLGWNSGLNEDIRGCMM